MAGDATTVSLREGAVTEDDALAVGRPGVGRRRNREPAAAKVRLRGAVSLWAIVALSLFIVVTAADRPSLLSPPSHYNYFPDWMAGPLRGLWPGLSTNSTTLRWLFTGAVVAMYVAYLVVLRSAERLPRAWILGGILAVHAVFILAPPLAMTDLFNYINYGRMEVLHNLNPYTSIPVVEPHSDPSYALSNWHQLFSPYGPLFTIITFAFVPLGLGGSFWVLKVLLSLTSLGTLWLVWRCARMLGRDPVKAVALVGLNPIVLVWGLGGDHNDFLMVFCIMLGFYLLLLSGVLGRRTAGSRPDRLRGWLTPLSLPQLGAGAAFVCAAGIKASGAVLIPIVLARLLRAPRALIQVLLGMAAAALVVAALSLAAFGLHIPDLSTQSSVVSNESIPNLIGLAIGSGGETETLRALMTAGLAVVLLLCCRLAWRRRDAITASGWANVALLFTLSWVLPWYILWPLPLAALSTSRRLRATVLIAGAYLIVAWAPASSLVWNAIGFHPENTPIGRVHARAIKELLN